MADLPYDLQNRDIAIRTILSEDPSMAGAPAVGAVILNRWAAGKYGSTIDDVTTAQNQFEGLYDATQKMRRGEPSVFDISTDDPRYIRIGQTLDAIATGAMPDPTNGATHFYSPSGQLARGRSPPVWAVTNPGQTIGGQIYYAPEGRVSYQAIHGVTRQPYHPREAGLTEDALPSEMKGWKFARQLPDAVTKPQPATQTAAPDPSQLPPEMKGWKFAKELPPSLPPPHPPPVFISPRVGQAAGEMLGGPPHVKDDTAALEANAKVKTIPAGPGPIDPSIAARTPRQPSLYDRTALAEPPDAATSPFGQYVRTGIGEAARGAKEAPGVIAGTIGPPIAEGYQLGRENVRKGVEGMKSGTMSGMGLGALQDIWGTMQEAASPLTGLAIGGLELGGMVDPMMTGGEGVGAVGKLLSEDKPPAVEPPPWPVERAFPQGKPSEPLPLPGASDPLPVGAVTRNEGTWGYPSEEAPPSLHDRPAVKEVDPSDYVDERFTTPSQRPTYANQNELLKASGYSDNQLKSMTQQQRNDATSYIHMMHKRQDFADSGIYDSYAWAENADIDREMEREVAAGRLIKPEGDIEQLHDRPAVPSLAVIPEHLDQFKPSKRAGGKGIEPSKPSYEDLYGPLPEPAKGAPPNTVRLYRGERESSGRNASEWAGGFWTGKKELASRFGEPKYIDVPVDEVKKNFVRINPDEFATQDPKYRQELFDSPLGRTTLPAHLDEFKPSKRATGDVGPKEVSDEGQSIGAAQTSTADILKDNIAKREAAMAQTPGFRDGVKHVIRTVKGIVAPQTLDESAIAAEGMIRQQWGRATRDAEMAKAAMEEYRGFVAPLDLQSRLDILDYIQKFTPKVRMGYVPTPDAGAFMSQFRDLMQKYRHELENLSDHERMQFQEDFASQMWEEPEKAAQFYGTKEGSGGFTKRKTYESYSEGIRAGLIPKTTDPIAIAVLYAENASRYIATEKIFNQAKEAGLVEWAKPGEQPDGWVELNGRAQYMGNMTSKAYAPQGFATVYNRAISMGPRGFTGDALRAVNRIATYSTALQLGLSGYHLLNTMKESIVSAMGGAVDDFLSVNILKAPPRAIAALFKPITSISQGKAVAKTYLTGIGDPVMRKIVDLAMDANFRVVGKGRAADDYRYAAQNYVDMWHRGTLGEEMRSTGRDVINRPVVGTMKAIAQGVGRSLDTITHPLFSIYIPMAKNTAFYDGMRGWLERNPEASIDEQRAAARYIANMIDDRFGEMNGDNIFWSKTAKLAAQSAVVSASYEMGTLRMFGGAMIDVAKAPYKIAHRQNPWTPKLSYVVALVIVTSMINAIDQYVRTGQAPDGLRDLMNPRTGGVVDVHGRKMPERAVNPGYDPQLRTFVLDPKQWLANKANSTLQTVGNLWTGKDWSGTDIALHKDSTLVALKKYMEYIVGQHLPIPMQQQRAPGSAIGPVERYMGVRPAGMAVTDPKGFQDMMDAVHAHEDKTTEQRLERRNYSPHVGQPPVAPTMPGPLAPKSPLQTYWDSLFHGGQ